MNWLDLALGLIREAAASEQGKEILNDLRESAFNRKDLAAARDVETLKSILEQRQAQMELNLERIVQMLNAQSETLIKTNRRQRIWNITLAAGLVVTIALAIYFSV